MAGSEHRIAIAVACHFCCLCASLTGVLFCAYRCRCPSIDRSGTASDRCVCGTTRKSSLRPASSACCGCSCECDEGSRSSFFWRFCLGHSFLLASFRGSDVLCALAGSRRASFLLSSHSASKEDLKSFTPCNGGNEVGILFLSCRCCHRARISCMAGALVVLPVVIAAHSWLVARAQYYQAPVSLEGEHAIWKFLEEYADRREADVGFSYWSVRAVS